MAIEQHFRGEVTVVTPPAAAEKRQLEKAKAVALAAASATSAFATSKEAAGAGNRPESPGSLALEQQAQFAADSMGVPQTASTDSAASSSSVSRDSASLDRSVGSPPRSPRRRSVEHTLREVSSCTIWRISVTTLLQLELIGLHQHPLF